MRATVTAAEIDELHASLGELLPMLDAVVPDDVAELELLALNLQVPFNAGELPVEAVRALPAALAERGDELAAALLAAMAALSAEPLSGLARAAEERLAGNGVTARQAGGVGTLAVGESFRLALGDDAEILGMVLQRPGEARSQAGFVFLEHEPCGGVVAGASLGGPEDPGAVRALVSAPGGDPAEPLAVSETCECLDAALAHMAAHDVALDADAAMMMPALERALTGRVGGFARPAVAAPDEAGDLADAFAAALDEDPDADPLLHEHGPFVALTLLEFTEGRPDGLTPGALRDYLLHDCPRGLDSDEETIAAVPACVVAFLRFLDDVGELSGGATVDALAATVERVRPRFSLQFCSS
jgi:hypothetical protein